MMAQGVYAALGGEVGRIHHGEADAGRELVCRIACHQHGCCAVEHSARGLNRVAHPAHHAHRSSGQVVAVHDGGI